MLCKSCSSTPADRSSSENEPVGIPSNTPHSVCDHKELESGAMEFRVVRDQFLRYYQGIGFEKMLISFTILYINPRPRGRWRSMSVRGQWYSLAPSLSTGSHWYQRVCIEHPDIHPPNTCLRRSEQIDALRAENLPSRSFKKATRNTEGAQAAQPGYG